MANTLWELVIKWRHDGAMTPNGFVHTGSDTCHRCQLEQWARDKKKKWKCHPDDYVSAAMCIEDLGVPESGDDNAY